MPGVSVIVKSLALTLLLSLSVSCIDINPTEPTHSENAIVRMDIENKPVDYNHNSRNRTFYANYTVVLSEHNGVGVDISRVKTEIFEGEYLCGSSMERGGRLPPGGSLEVACYFEVPDKYQYDRLVITAEGIDDKGQSVSVSMAIHYLPDPP